MSYNPNDYTRCEKCKHIDRENEKCKITNDNWLVSDRAGTCHQFEGVESMKVKCVRKHVSDKGITVGNVYNVLDEEDSVFYIQDDDCKRRAFNKWKFRIVEDGIKTPEQPVEEISNVNHPSHYNKGKFEVIDVIEDWNLGFNLGNTIKYIARCEHKGNKKQDLEKAMWYLRRELEKGEM